MQKPPKSHLKVNETGKHEDIVVGETSVLLRVHLDDHKGQ